MQNELSIRMEKIWSMAEIALAQGSIDYGTKGHSKIAHICGMRFKFNDDVLVRLRGQRLDVAIIHQKPQDGVSFFPGAQTQVEFLTGDDAALSRAHMELTSMQKTFSSKAA